MNKKTTIFLLPMIMAIFMLVLTPTVSAQETETREAGLTPNSPIYFIDTWSEDISLALTQGTEARARKQYDISQEKLSEIEEMAEIEDADAAETAADRYSSMVEGAAQTLSEAAQSGEEIDSALSELISTATARSAEVLLGVLEKVPEQAKTSIQRAIQASGQGSQKALEAVSAENREATQQQVEGSLQQARDKAPEEARQFIPKNIPSQPETNQEQGGSNAAPSLPDQAGQRGR
ncbi:MAG: DUF5667 domain-containing protein [Patescibacteria group bacterium]